MAPLIRKVGRTCVVALAVMYSVVYLCARLVFDGIWFPFEAMYEKLKRLVSN